MAKPNQTIAKLKKLYTEFGYEYTPYPTKEISKAITLPQILEEYYKKIGAIENEQIKFPMHIVKPGDLQELDEYLVFAHEMQGYFSFAIKKSDLNLDNPPIYTNWEAKDTVSWRNAVIMNDEDYGINYNNLLECFYTIACMMGVDAEPRNTPENIKIVQDVLTGNLPEDAIHDEIIKNITYLSFGTIELKNIEAIAKLKNLFHFNVMESNLTTIEPFLDLPKLKELFCSHSNISHINGIEQLKQLKHVSLGWNKIEDISPIGKMAELVYAGFGWNAIKDVSVIATMPQLECFYAQNNQLCHLPIFQEGSRMYDLRLSDNQITNVDSLSALKKLKVLWLDGNKITDISVLKDLDLLNTLLVDRGTKVPDIKNLRVNFKDVM